MFELFDAFLTPIVGVAVFAVTLYFATPIKDFFKGIPADLRAQLTSVETAAATAVKAAKADVVKTAVSTALTSVKVAAPAAAPAPAAPVVLTPAPAPAPAPLAPTV